MAMGLVMLVDTDDRWGENMGLVVLVDFDDICGREHGSGHAC